MEWDGVDKMFSLRKNKDAVRYAKKKDLERVNVLRKQLHDLNCTASPDDFPMPFGEKLEQEALKMLHDRDGILLVAQQQGEVCGYVYARCQTEPESLYRLTQRYCAVLEICVDKAVRGQGIGTQLLLFLQDEAAKKGFGHLKLNVWQFNAAASAFFEKHGFTTYMRCMERKPSPAEQDGENVCLQ